MLVKDFANQNFGPQALANVNGTLFFTADDGVNGRELWKSDGTAAGTVLVSDMTPGSGGSSVRRFAELNGMAFFAANGGLWKSDGTATGTVVVKDGISISSVPLNVNGMLFFEATDTVHGYELWRSNGTTAGTIRIDTNIATFSSPGVITSLTGVNNTLFFTSLGSLWKSDGTQGGTVPVGGLATVGDLRNVNGTLFFTADDGVNGRELWKSDGTVAGTVLVRDINPGVNSGPSVLTNVNGILFFLASDDVTGAELWKSDGTAAGTVLVKDIIVGSGQSVPQHLTNVNGTLFFTADDGVHGRELWASGLANNLLANDTDPDGSTLTASLGTGPTNGTLVLNPDGTFIYRPNENFVGTDTFTYTVSDGTQSSNLATVTITVV